jgi:hypothetical protein
LLNRASAWEYFRICFASEEAVFADKHLSVYLIDHLAGASVALDLLEHLTVAPPARRDFGRLGDNTDSIGE